MKKTMLLLTVMVFLVTWTAWAQAEGTVVRPRLVRTVTEYGVDFDTQEWTPVRTWSYSYENGYPVSVDRYEIDADNHVITSFSYVFDGDLPTERKSLDDDGNLLSVTEYHNGRVYNVIEEDEDRRNVLYYQYGNGDEYFTLVLRDERIRNTEDPEGVSDYSEEVDAISVTTENGLLVKTVNTGMYANWSDREEKEWLRFSGTYTAEYDEDGIAVLTSAVHRVGPSGVDGRYELTKADGVVTGGSCFIPEENDSWLETARFTFEYTDTETTPARYAQMINSFLMGTESSYYKYNWY
ncbi:MAG: hypothetical protein IKH77_00850 [Clostridia bacterium]|nr:hypothetical protein [Clostridia bacterium]